MPYLQPRRELARVECGVARRLTQQGKREQAVGRLLRLARVTRRWEGKEPFVIAALVNFAIRMIAIEGFNDALRCGGPLSAALHDDIDREMAESESILRLVPYFERFETIACTSDYDDLSPLGVTRLLQPFADNDRAYMVQFMHRWAKTGDRPLYEIRSELDAMELGVKEIAGDRVRRWMYIGSVMNLPAANQMRYRLDRFIVLSRCLRIVNAMARRNDFHASLGSLGLPQECLVDSFDGKPMRIKATPKGPIVYSIDQNFIDDGGAIGSAIKPGLDSGLGPPPDAKKP